MKNKDFREIQVSSSLLVVIFLGVLALGVFIFLLGVSVGKRQAVAAAPTQIVTQQIPEPVKEPPAKTETPGTTPGGMTSDPAAQVTNPLVSGADAPASKPEPKATVSDKPPASAAKPPAESKKAPVAAPAPSGLYYVQVAAFPERAQAQAFAETFKKQGYTTTLSTRQAGARTWYRVRLGGFKTRDQANDLLNKLNAAAGKKTDYQIVRD